MHLHLLHAAPEPGSTAVCLSVCLLEPVSSDRALLAQCISLASLIDTYTSVARKASEARVSGAQQQRGRVLLVARGAQGNIQGHLWDCTGD